MPIRVNILYCDMLNFFRNQFVKIMLLVMLTSLISVVLGYVLSPNSEQLMAISDGAYIDNITDISLQQLVQQMSVEQQHVLIQITAASTLSGLIGNTILVGGLLTMIFLVSNHKPVSVLRAIGLSAPLLPRLLLLIFLIMLLVQLGLLLLIIPGILLAITFSLAPVIATSDNLGVIKSMRLSASMAFINFNRLAPAVLFWLLAKTVVLLLTTQFARVSSLVAAVSFTGLSNLISALLLIYLYRLYMLLRQA